MAQHGPHSDEQTCRGEEETTWSYVATAPDQLTAELWQQLLSEDAIPSMLAPQDTISFLGLSSAPVRLMVPSDLEIRARNLLARSLERGNEKPTTGESRD